MDFLEEEQDRWIVPLVACILFISFLWLNRTYGEPESDKPNSTGTMKDRPICYSPNCARCQSLSTNDLKLRLKNRFQNSFNSSLQSGFSAQRDTVTRVEGMVDSTCNKHDILSSIYKESGYEIEDKEKLDSLPHVWLLPGLMRRMFWDSKVLPDIFSYFEHSLGNLQTIKSEFQLINSHHKRWKINSVPSGRWRVYHLYDQGERIDENCKDCPRTTQLLEDLSSFMRHQVFGNAMFSVLEPGSSIEPHAGPCNFRLRCHLPLVTPPGYKLKVGKDISIWEEGKLIIFDDSYIHEVWHEQRTEDSVDQGRVVLIFDIWHPQVTKEEQTALEYIFK